MSGSCWLDAAVVDCAARWHHRPAIKGGQLIDTPMTVKVAWRLGDDDNGKNANADADKKVDGGTQ